MQNVPISIEYKGKYLTGVADPVESAEESGVPRSLVVYIHGKYLGILKCGSKGWSLDRPADPELVETLGNYIVAWYE